MLMVPKVMVSEFKFHNRLKSIMYFIFKLRISDTSSYFVR